MHPSNIVAAVDPSIVVACVSAIAAVIAAAIAGAGKYRSSETEEERLDLQVWKDSVAELRTQVDGFRSEVRECHDARDADRVRWQEKEDQLVDELGGMKASNQALRMRIAVLEAHVESLTGRPIGGDDA